MKLPDHLFVSICDGGLYDTRVPKWSHLPPLRGVYQRSFTRITSLAEVKATIRNGAFAWPGGYPMFFFTRDGAALCFTCARKEFRQVVWDYLNKASTGWKIVGCDINYEDANLTCDHCNKPIESAYGEQPKETNEHSNNG